MKEIVHSIVSWTILFSLFMVFMGYGITSRPSWQKRFFALPKMIQKLYVAFFMAPVIMLPLVPQPRHAYCGTAGMAVGILLTVTAMVTWGLALRQMRGVPSVRKATGLVTGGVYKMVRNPIYTANFLILPGLGLITGSAVALIYAPVWFVLLAVLCVLEEKDLKKQYGEAYRDYMEQVPYRLIRFVF